MNRRRDQLGPGFVAEQEVVMRRLGLLAAILVIGGASIWAASWQEIDKGLPSIVAGAGGLAIDPSAPSTLYSWGLSWGSGALFKSTDGAASWNIVNGVTGVHWAALHPKDSRTLYAGTNRGLAKSADGGATWIGLDTGADWVGQLVIDPQDSNIVYAVVYTTSFVDVIKSTNGGASWKPSSRWVTWGSVALTIDPVTPSTLYAVGGNGGGGIFKSTDGEKAGSQLRRAKKKVGGPWILSGP